MFHDLKSLLGGALRRNQITRQVTVAQTLEAANAAIQELLPSGREGDAEALSLHDGTLKIACANAPAAQFLSARKDAIRAGIAARVPSADVRDVRTEIGAARGMLL